MDLWGTPHHGTLHVYCGEWDLGRIYQTRGGPDNLRWN
jgi:hypothetical protein